MSDELQTEALWFAVLTVAGTALMLSTAVAVLWWWIEGEFDDNLYAWADTEDSHSPGPAPLRTPRPSPRGLAAL